MCLLLNVVVNSESEAFSCLVKLWIASSWARLLLVIWAPVGDVSVLVSAYFVYQNNGRAKAYNNYAWGVRNLHSRPSDRKVMCGTTLGSQRNGEKSRLRTKWYVKYVGPNSHTTQLESPPVNTTSRQAGRGGGVWLFFFWKHHCLPIDISRF